MKEFRKIEGVFTVAGIHPTATGDFAVNLRTEDNVYMSVFQPTRPTIAGFLGEVTVLSEKDVEVEVNGKKEPRKNIVATISRVDRKIESIVI